MLQGSGTLPSAIVYGVPVYTATASSHRIARARNDLSSSRSAHAITESAVAVSRTERGRWCTLDFFVARRSTLQGSADVHNTGRRHRCTYARAGRREASLLAVR